MDEHDPVIGHFFIALPPGGTSWSGKIISKVTDGIYFVEVYDWALAEPRTRMFASAAQIVNENWHFYNTQGAWDFDNHSLQKQIAEAYEAEHKRQMQDSEISSLFPDSLNQKLEGYD